MGRHGSDYGRRAGERVPRSRRCAGLALALAGAVLMGLPPAAAGPASEVGSKPGQPGFSYRALPPSAAYVAPTPEADPRDTRIDELFQRVKDLEERLEVIEQKAAAPKALK